MKIARDKAAQRANGSVLRQIADLERMSAVDLVKRWRVLYGDEPPRSNNRQFLVKRLAYRIQELVYGGLAMSARERMDRILEENGYDENGAKSKGAGRKLSGNDVQLTRGTILAREWKDERHEVRVIDGGFEYRGMPYRSLSAVARAITGTSWNGPLFFGLRSKAGKKLTIKRSSDAT
jgi:hypothetical protein